MADTVTIVNITTDPTTGNITLQLRFSSGTILLDTSLSTSLAQFQGLALADVEKALINLIGNELKQLKNAISQVDGTSKQWTMAANFIGKVYTFA